MVHHVYEKYVNELAKDAINVNDTINDNSKNITKEKNTIVVPIMPLLQLNPKIAVNVPPNSIYIPNNHFYQCKQP
mgnify:CR=1 FL=1